MWKLEWTRRDFLKTAGAWAGAGLLQPVLPLIGAGKSIAAAYPDEVLSIEKYTKGRVKAGMVISKDNADLVKDIAPEGLYVELKQGREIKVADATTQLESFVPKYWIEATLRNKGRAVLDKKGQLWTKDGKPWVGGDPFPEPKSALEAAYNSYFNFPRVDDQTQPWRGFIIDGEGNVVRREAGWFVDIYTTGRLVKPPAPSIPEYSSELYRRVLAFTEPFDSYGLAILTTVLYDQSKLPTTDLYVPSLRRVRRVPSTQRFDPVAPYSVAFISDIGTFNDPIQTWSYKLVGRRPMLYPSPANKGTFAKGATKSDFVFPYSEEKFPRSTWELRPEVLVVEAQALMEGSPYGRKLVYVDAIINRANCSDIWDRQGKPWKFIFYAFSDVLPNVTTYCAQCFSDLQKDFREYVWLLPEFTGMKVGTNVGIEVKDWATPAALLKRARR